MKTIESALFHRVLEPRTPQASIHPLLVLLHGLGADEEDLLGLASYLDERFLIISVRAPYAVQFSGGYTWYNFGDAGIPEPTMFRLSCDKLSTFVDDALAQYPVDKGNVYLLGFSMGTAMSYALALTRPAAFRGVVANSGYIAENTHLTYLWDQLASTRFFVAHGTEDPVIPIHLARRARSLLESGHASVEYKEYPMVHQISEESLRDFSRWLTERLDHVAKE